MSASPARAQVFVPDFRPPWEMSDQSHTGARGLPGPNPGDLAPEVDQRAAPALAGERDGTDVAPVVALVAVG